MTVNVALAPAAPVIADTSLVALNGLAGTELTHTFATTGNPAPTLTATGLPTGLTLSDTGVLTGTPTIAGSFTVTADNAVGTPATLSVTLTVAAAPAAPIFTDAGPVALNAATELPELDVARVVKYCASEVPDRLRHEIRVECDIAPRHVTICECRPPWREDLG